MPIDGLEKGSDVLGKDPIYTSAAISLKRIADTFDIIPRVITEIANDKTTSPETRAAMLRVLGKSE